jgi:hypothetical protein
MAFVGGTRIDDGDLTAPDDISVGAEEGVGSWIVGDDAPNARRDLLGHAIVDVNAAIEGKLRRHDLGLLGNLSLILAERTGGGSAALQAALTFPSLFAQNVSCHKGLAPRTWGFGLGISCGLSVATISLIGNAWREKP